MFVNIKKMCTVDKYVVKKTMHDGVKRSQSAEIKAIFNGLRKFVFFVCFGHFKF